MANDLMGRWAALSFLEKILEDHLPLDQAFDQTCRQFGDKLSAQDKGFVRHLGTTCLRHLGQLDAMINHCTPKKLSGSKKTIRNILRLGITQLLYMAVPAHAAVNSAVKMADKQKDTSDRHSKGMVNAILRRIDREKEKFSTGFNPTLNIPKWLQNNWEKRFGSEEVAKIATILLEEPPTDFSLKPQYDGEEWAKKLGGVLLANGSIRVEKAGIIPNLEGYNDGIWWVQDMAASLPMRLLSPKEGDFVLDLCAAPGGKTAQAAAMGCKVTALDQSERRLRRLEENMKRLNLVCDIVTSDAATYKPDHAYHHILLDAPCSSTGTMRRHPDVSRAKGPKDIESLRIIQANLLDAAVNIMPVGGTLVYCVCSMQAEEGPDQIKALLARNDTVKRKKIMTSELAGFENAILTEGDVQTLPHHIDGGMDGFFISRLVKASNS
ncbi:MAG: hypothetical protein K9G26_02115 [Emcibacter sp.]|nr:hypothetical protein [Emcibacter sp.]